MSNIRNPQHEEGRSWKIKNVRPSHRTRLCLKKKKFFVREKSAAETGSEVTGLLPFLPASAFIPHTDCKTTLLLAKSRVRLTELLLWLHPPSHWLHTPGESLDLWPFLDMETCSSRGRGQDHHSYKQSGGPWGDPEQLRGVCCVGWGGGVLCGVGWGV